MSGANQIPKFARVNREGQLAPLSAIGTEFHQRDVSAAVTAAGLTAAQFANDLLFTAATPTPMTGPTAVQMCTYFQTLQTSLEGERGLNPTAIGSRYEIVIENQDAVDKVINLGGGFTPASITLTAGTTYLASFELTAINPQAWELFMLIPTTGAGGGPAGIQQVVGSQGTIYNGPVFTTSAGDYTAAEVTNVPAGTIASVDVQGAINELDGDVVALTAVVNNKVTLRDTAGVVGTGAAQLGDILVASAAGDNYVPSNNNGTRGGHIGAMQVGSIAGATVQSANNLFALDVLADGAIPVNGIVSGELGATGSATNGYAVFRGDASNAGAGFGNGTRQNVYRAIISPLAPVTVGVAPAVGAFAFALDVAGTPIFYVNAAGNIHYQQTAGPGANAAGRDANGMLCDNASNRHLKENFKDLDTSELIYKLKPQKFTFKSNPELPRQGLVVEDLQDLGFPSEYFAFQGSKQKPGQFDIERPTGICWEAITASLVQEIQKLRVDVEKLKSRRSKKE